MEATLEIATDILRQIAEGLLTDGAGHLHMPTDDAWQATRMEAAGLTTPAQRRQHARLIAPSRVLQFLHAAGETEYQDLKDFRTGEVVNRHLVLKKRP